MKLSVVKGNTGAKLKVQLECSKGETRVWLKVKLSVVKDETGAKLKVNLERS
ncbi:hypothetical protein D3C74_319220 [compost metagenome]